MARKTTSRPGAQADTGSVIDRMGSSEAIPPTPSESRPGSSVSLEMVNVFGEPEAEGTGSARARLRLTAWVNNVSYVKDVWVDAYLIDPSGAVAHSETLVLDYHEGAGGGGDFFVLDAPIPSGGTGSSAVAGLRYRLYYQIGETVYTEGILHEHSLPVPAPAKPAPAAAQPVATAKRSTGQTPAKPGPKLAAKAGKVVAEEGKASPKRGATTTAAPKTPLAPPAESPPKRTSPRRPSV